MAPKVARGPGGEQVEGRQAVRELFLAGRRRVRELILEADLPDSEILDDIASLAAEARVPVRELSRSRFRSIARTEAPQGVVAMADSLPEVDLDSIARPGPEQAPPLLLALDGVTDPGNLGAVLRSAEAAGVSGVILPRHRAVRVTPAVTKAAAGAVEHLPLTLVGGLPAAIDRLRELGVWVVGLDMGGEVSIYELGMVGEPLALVLGAEGRGLSRLVRQRCDVRAHIPLKGRLGSLNVAAAGAIACHEVSRCRAAAAEGGDGWVRG